MVDNDLLEHEGCELSMWVASFHGGTTSCPLFILDITYAPHEKLSINMRGVLCKVLTD